MLFPLFILLFCATPRFPLNICNGSEECKMLKKNSNMQKVDDLRENEDSFLLCSGLMRWDWVLNAYRNKKRLFLILKEPLLHYLLKFFHQSQKSSSSSEVSTLRCVLHHISFQSSFPRFSLLSDLARPSWPCLSFQWKCSRFLPDRYLGGTLSRSLANSCEQEKQRRCFWHVVFDAYVRSCECLSFYLHIICVHFPFIKLIFLIWKTWLTV